MDNANEIIDRFQQKAAARGNWENHWQEVAELVFTKQADFTAKKTPGEKRDQKIFDGTAPSALETFAAAAVSYTAPSTEKWHALRHPDDAAMEVKAVAEWYELLTDALFRYRYSGRSAFQSQIFENYLTMGAFGTGAMWIGGGTQPGDSPVWYRAKPLSAIYIAENAQGRIDQVDEKAEYTARQAFQMFGEKLPDNMQRAARQEPSRAFTFLHCVYPNGEYDAPKADRRGMPWASAHVCLDEPKILEEGGFRKFPYAIGRYTTYAGEVYGRGPAMTKLPAIKGLNAMMRSEYRGRQLRAEPPLLLAKEGTLAKFHMAPYALNHGAMSANGQRLVEPLFSGAQPESATDLIELVRNDIRTAFLMHLFQILVDLRDQTATEALIRDQEKGQLLGPQLGRTMHEFFGPLIEREIDILAAKRLLPEPPPELTEFGASYEVEYVSPLTRAQSAGDALSFQQVLADILPLAENDPSILQRFDVDEVLKGVAKARGMPARYLRSDEEMVELEQAEAERKQAEAAVGAAPVVADTINKLAQANKYSADARAAGQ